MQMRADKKLAGTNRVRGFVLQSEHTNVEKEFRHNTRFSSQLDHLAVQHVFTSPVITSHLIAPAWVKRAYAAVFYHCKNL